MVNVFADFFRGGGNTQGNEKEMTGNKRNFRITVIQSFAVLNVWRACVFFVLEGFSFHLCAWCRHRTTCGSVSALGSSVDGH